MTGQKGSHLSGTPKLLNELVSIMLLAGFVSTLGLTAISHKTKMSGGYVLFSKINLGRILFSVFAAALTSCGEELKNFSTTQSYTNTDVDGPGWLFQIQGDFVLARKCAQILPQGEKDCIEMAKYPTFAVKLKMLKGIEEDLNSAKRSYEFNKNAAKYLDLELIKWQKEIDKNNSAINQINHLKPDSSAFYYSVKRIDNRIEELDSSVKAEVAELANVILALTNSPKDSELQKTKVNLEQKIRPVREAIEFQEREKDELQKDFKIRTLEFETERKKIPSIENKSLELKKRIELKLPFVDIDTPASLEEKANIEEIEGQKALIDVFFEKLGLSVTLRPKVLTLQSMVLFRRLIYVLRDGTGSETIEIFKASYYDKSLLFYKGIGGSNGLIPAVSLPAPAREVLCREFGQKFDRSRSIEFPERLPRPRSDCKLKSNRIGFKFACLGSETSLSACPKVALSEEEDNSRDFIQIQCDPYSPTELSKQLPNF